MTTTRKLFTILFSVMLYGHVLSSLQWLGVALVFVGLSIDVVEKKRRQDNMSGMAGHVAADKRTSKPETDPHAKQKQA